MWTYLSRRKCVFEEEEGGVHFEDNFLERLTTYSSEMWFNYCSYKCITSGLINEPYTNRVK